MSDGAMKLSLDTRGGGGTINHLSPLVDKGILGISVMIR
jgi:hypothetical protein